MSTNQTTKFSPGDRVLHPRYGAGVVQLVDSESVVVRFGDGVEKLLVLQFARLELLYSIPGENSPAPQENDDSAKKSPIQAKNERGENSPAGAKALLPITSLRVFRLSRRPGHACAVVQVFLADQIRIVGLRLIPTPTGYALVDLNASASVVCRDLWRKIEAEACDAYKAKTQGLLLADDRVEPVEATNA